MKSSTRSSLRLRFVLLHNHCPRTCQLMRERIDQAIAPLLIVQRVANKRALTSDTIVTGHAISFNVETRGGSTVSDDGPLGRYPTSSVDERGKRPDEPLARVVAATNLRQASEA